MDKKKQEELKQQIKQAASEKVQEEGQEERAKKQPPEEQPRILSIVFDPTPEHIQKLEGEDKYRFTNRRWFGCSVYVPLAEYCSRLMQSDDPVDRMTGAEHLGDSFLIDRDTYPLSPNEQAVANAAHNTAHMLFENGALPPLAMVPVKYNGVQGVETLKNHYVPSCGYNTKLILPSFIRYMEDPEQWLQKTRDRMFTLAGRIKAGLEKPVRGYFKN